jgi:hypothetical protein
MSPVQNSTACVRHTCSGLEGMCTVARCPQYAQHVTATRINGWAEPQLYRFAHCRKIQAGSAASPQRLRRPVVPRRAGAAFPGVPIGDPGPASSRGSRPRIAAAWSLSRDFRYVTASIRIAAANIRRSALSTLARASCSSRCLIRSRPAYASGDVATSAARARSTARRRIAAGIFMGSVYPGACIRAVS